MSQFYRAYYAIRRLTNREGLPTGAVFGFTNMLRKLVEDEHPDYLAVAMDLPGPTVRHEQFPDYKATRPPMPEDLSRQIPYLHRVCRVFRVPMLSHPGYEADDIIATVTRQADESGLEVVIVSVDKDLFQIVGSNVTILDTRTMTRFDPAGVEKKFGVAPHQLGDLLSLVGDTSDNIPGAKGIGAKGAVQLLRTYGDLENLLAHRDEVRRKTYRESLQQNEAVVRQSRELVRMHDRIPLDLDLETLKVAEPDPAKARELFLELNFTRLLEEFLPEPETAGGEYERYESGSQFDALMTRLKGVEAGLALLPGATGKTPVQGIGVSTGQGQGIHLPADLLESDSNRLLSLLNRPKRWIIHDLKPLLMLADRQGWQLKPQFADTRLMAYLLTPNQNDFSLKRLATQRLQTRLAESDAGLFPDEEELLARSADLTVRLFRVLEADVRTHGLEDLLTEVEIPLVGVLVDMEAAGVKVDREMLESMSRRMGREIQVLADRVTELAGEKFNLNSPKQLGTILFEKLGLPPPKKTPKAKHYSTGVEVLQRLAGEHEIAGRILEYREQTKLKNTYLDALPGLVDSDSGRIHTSYNQMVAATGRLSSSDPNLQNIPIKTELGRQIRRAFVAEEGYRLLAADYSQIELRVMAHLSEDPVLVEAFRQGEDIHDRTAAEVLGERADLTPRERRRYAKIINFGILYGVSAFGLAQNLEIGRWEAKRLIDEYFERYQGVKRWSEATLAEAYETGSVRTLFGRLRQIPELKSKNWNLRSFGERTAVNAPIQGTAADLIKKAMVSTHRSLSRRGLSSRLILQVHDELVVEVLEAEMDEVRELVREKMEGVAALRVPLKVDMATGQSWYEAK